MADQAGVWEDVARSKHREVGVRSPTGAMGDAYRRAWPGVAEVFRAFPEPQAGQTGLAACLGGPLAAVDLFDRPDPWPPRGRGCSPATPRTPWGRAPRRCTPAPRRWAPAPRAPRPPRPRWRALLAEAARAEATPHPGVGLGTDVVLTTAALVGSALAGVGDGRGSRGPVPVGRRTARERAARGPRGGPGAWLDRLNRLDRRAHLGGIGSADRFEGP